MSLPTRLQSGIANNMCILNYSHSARGRFGRACVTSFWGELGVKSATLLIFQGPRCCPSRQPAADPGRMCPLYAARCPPGTCAGPMLNDSQSRPYTRIILFGTSCLLRGGVRRGPPRRPGTHLSTTWACRPGGLRHGGWGDSLRSPPMHVAALWNCCASAMSRCVSRLGGAGSAVSQVRAYMNHGGVRQVQCVCVCVCVCGCVCV